ncbi:MAG: hypothetical protein J6X35_00675 [Bacteroidales bacterium]|nr:hypothetical protein [Bacteroidales bacterium]
MKLKNVNIGQEIKKLVGERYTSYASFARKIGKSRQSVQTQIFSKKSLQTDLLVRISEELEVNLFELFQNDEAKVIKNNDKERVAFNVHFDTTQEELKQMGIYEQLKELVRQKGTR